MTSMSWLLQGSGLVTKADMHRFMKECLVKAGAPPEHAIMVADVLLEADCRGHRDHGFDRLALFIREIETRRCDPCAVPVVLNESLSTAWVDGCNCLGPVAANFSINLAISKAKDHGVAIVSTKGSNYCGIHSAYSTKALENGMIGFCCSNCEPGVAPTRCVNPFLGNNALTLAAPSLNDEAFVLDMAASAATFDKIEHYKATGKKLPHAWALDERGHVTMDPEVAMRTRCMLPLGGLEETGGHKGTGLALMLQALGGVLSGGSSVVKIPRTSDGDVSFNWGHFFMVIAPKYFAPNYESRLFDLTSSLREFHAMDPGSNIGVPGDPENDHIKKVDRAGGISYHSTQLKKMMTIAKQLDVPPVTIK